DRDGRRHTNAGDGGGVERELAARTLRRTGGRGGDGPLPRVERRRLQHRPGDERRRRGDPAPGAGARTIPLPEPDAIDPSAPTQGPAPKLMFEGVAKTYPDGTRALAPTTLSVAPGEFVTIVGPSGCGKSTLLRVASGLERPSAGTVTVDRK